MAAKPPMKPITLNLDDRHLAVLKELAEAQAISQSTVLRQGLRLYQMIYERAKKGEQIAFTKNGKLVPVVIVGLPAFD